MKNILYIHILIILFNVLACYNHPLRESYSKQESLQYFGTNPLAKNIIDDLNKKTEILLKLKEQIKTEQLLLDETSFVYDHIRKCNYIVPILNSDNTIESYISLQTEGGEGNISNINIIDIEYINKLPDFMKSIYARRFSDWQKQHVISKKINEYITILNTKSNSPQPASRALDLNQYYRYSMDTDHLIEGKTDLTKTELYHLFNNGLVYINSNSYKHIKLLEINYLVNHKMGGYFDSTIELDDIPIRAFIKELYVGVNKALIRSGSKSRITLTGIDYSLLEAGIAPKPDEENPPGKPETYKCSICHKEICSVTYHNMNNELKAITDSIWQQINYLESIPSYMQINNSKDTTYTPTLHNFDSTIYCDPTQIHAIGLVSAKRPLKYEFSRIESRPPSDKQDLSWSIRHRSFSSIVFYPSSYTLYPTPNDLIACASFTNCKYNFIYTPDNEYVFYTYDETKARAFRNIYSPNSDKMFTEGSQYRADWDYAYNTLYTYLAPIHKHLHALAYVMEKHDAGILLFFKCTNSYMYLVSAHNHQGNIEPTLFYPSY